MGLSAYSQGNRKNDQEKHDGSRGSVNSNDKNTSDRTQNNTRDNKNQAPQTNNRNTNIDSHENNNHERNNGNVHSDNNRSDNNQVRNSEHNNTNYYRNEHNSNDWDRNRRVEHIVTYDIRRPERTDRYYRDRVVYRADARPERRVHYDYRIPVRNEFVWSVDMNRNFRTYYPEVTYWRYNEGDRIRIIPAYDAIDFIGGISTVYGKIVDAYYEYSTDQYYFYFGDVFPNQNFSIIIPGREARFLNPTPERYLIGQNMAATGYISQSDERPEIVIRNSRQVEVY